MRTPDLIAAAVSNTFRSKTRTILTILAIFVGAFTLTITSGLGTGINRFIDSTVSSFGASNVMTVTKALEIEGASTDGPAEYDPDRISGGALPGGGPDTTVTALTPDDLDTIAAIEGVESVTPTISIAADFVQAGDGTRFVAGVGPVATDDSLTLAAGSTPDSSASEFEVALPLSYVEPMGFADAEAAIGSEVTIALTDAERTQQLIEATVVGVTEAGFAPTGEALAPNEPLLDALSAAQNTGVSAADQDRYASASVQFADDATEEQIAALKDRLADEGYSGSTVADVLGTFTAVIDGIVLVLNAFAIIALLAASFGIVNTLFMSVQERTREIGLMKAMGMGSGRVFSLFSLEAIFIGLLGSVIAVLAAIGVGTAISEIAAENLFSDLPGLTLIAFDPASIATIIVAVMGIAFLAGTLPAARAAKADPVESLRYE